MKRLDTSAVLRLGELFRGAGRVCVTAHTHPDGDALGSVAALSCYLREIVGCEVLALLPDAFPDTLAFIPGAGGVMVAESCPQDAASGIASCGLLVMLDFNEPSRCGCLEGAVRSFGGEKVMIDHHLHPCTEGCTVVFSDPDVSSTCELLYYVLRELGGGLPRDAADALLAGMTTDSNNFANSVFPTTLRMAGELIEAGADREGILQHLYNEFKERRFRAMGHFLSESMVILPGGIAYAIFDKETAARFKLADGDTEGFVNLPLGIGDVCMSLFLREDDGHFRVSIRSKRGWSARDMASAWFHGGGHECASGGKLYFPGDIASPGEAAAYVEEIAARFLSGCAACR